MDADGAGPAKAWTEYYVYDGQHVALVYRDPDGPSGAQPAVLRARVLHGEAVDQVLAQEDVTTLSTPGTVRDVVNSQGQVRNHLVYDAFGKVVSETNAAVDFLFGYTGRERDEETGLHYYRARYYDPAVGRFVSEDPIGFAAGDANLYRYVGNEVTNATDPSGLWRIKRRGQPWAFAIAEKGDTAADLAKLIHLDAEEYHKWLRVSGESVHPRTVHSALPTGCAYQVPNTIGVYTSVQTGFDYWFPPSWLFGMANKARRIAVASGRKAEREGFMVVYRLDGSSDDVFKELWTLDGISGIAFGGHGAEVDGSWLGFIADPENESAVRPSDVKPPYKLHAIKGFSCGSANPIDASNLPIGGPPTMMWSDLLSENGSFVGYFGAVTTLNQRWRIRVIRPSKDNTKE